MKRLALLLALCGAFLPMTLSAENKTETLVLGGGCFWCTEATYELVPGVKSVVSGYTGGKQKNPSYEAVCSGMTGHAEVIRIEYDPQQVSLEKLLEFFWTVHDPTTLNRQGADEGTQYRSVIYYGNDLQKAAAEKSKAAAQSKFADPIVTEISPLKEFYEAEDYHQDYFRKNPQAGYCQYVVKPKVAKAKKLLGK
jgi:peptide-methionine (S)-S-oxide reductase